ncbi:hypothetical protein [Ruegeria faecimaris]|uniref:hypothetical protein n=1 Tax=Ruegeria faecimaris TaxID=686389 RepID=UPI0024938FB2|nr:hypothetical protein [Ruegeria faecimaris]
MPSRPTLISALVICFAGAADAQNRQPLSTSLTECSVIFTEQAELRARRNKDQTTTDAVLASAALFVVEARDQAAMEGIKNPYKHIQSAQVRLSETWHVRFGNLALLNENKDWIDYCRALGKDRGLTLP